MKISKQDPTLKRLEGQFSRAGEFLTWEVRNSMIASAVFFEMMMQDESIDPARIVSVGREKHEALMIYFKMRD